jgi:hypothetical protein
MFWGLDSQGIMVIITISKENQPCTQAVTSALPRMVSELLCASSIDRRLWIYSVATRTGLMQGQKGQQEPVFSHTPFLFWPSSQC